MELYILDSLLRRTQVVDQFESIIWTTRYAAYGDFELIIKSSFKTRNQFQLGTMLAVNNSYRVMTVETVEDIDATDGKETLKVKGRSLEAILLDRVVKYRMSGTTTDPVWHFLDTPGNIARTMFDHIVRNGALDFKDKIPFLQPGTIFSPGTNPETTTQIMWDQKPEILYTAIKAVCDPYDLGFRLIRNFDASELYFDVYTGDDRTTKQTHKTPVIFGPNFDNIQNTSELSNINGSKNVAYVFSLAGLVVVYQDNIDPDIDGFDRKILVVNSGVALDNPDANTLMIEEGRQALNTNRSTKMFDGEINQYSKLQIGIDYNLGDMVELRNKDGIITYSRITENIFVSDGNGDRSYPTLTADAFFGLDTWISRSNKSTVWFDYDTDMDTTWSTL